MRVRLGKLAVPDVDAQRGGSLTTRFKSAQVFYSVFELRISFVVRHSRFVIPSLCCQRSIEQPEHRAVATVGATRRSRSVKSAVSALQQRGNRIRAIGVPKRNQRSQCQRLAGRKPPNEHHRACQQRAALAPWGLRCVGRRHGRFHFKEALRPPQVTAGLLSSSRVKTLDFRL